jgi:DNA-binding IscR family transcriptional regulator
MTFDRRLDPNAKCVYAFLQSYTAKHRMAPSHREIAEACHISKGTVASVLWRLENRRLIDLIPGKARGIILRDRDL